MKKTKSFMSNIIIFGIKYKIKYVNLLSDNYLGWFKPIEQEILIEHTLKGDKRMKTLIHEIGHGVFHTTGLNQTSIGYDLQEIIVENIAQAIVQNFDIKPKK